ncbi:MAG: HD domain-containing protein [Candidatus Methanosuratincola petrocarbonis]
MSQVQREEAIELVRKHVKKENNLKHMLAVGAVMKGLAVRLGEDQEKWEVTGILHDIDFEVCSGLGDHTLVASRMLEGLVEDDVLEAIKAYNYENTGVMPDSNFKRALIASDAVSGLVVAAALVMPSKRLKDVTVETLIKKYKSKDFARGADRGRIASCSEMGITVEEFLGIALESMQKIAGELGL